MAQQRGAALLTTFLLMLVLSGLALAVGIFSNNSLVGGKSQLHDAQAFYIAEAGLQRARQQLVAENWSAGSSYTESFGAGQYEVSIVDNGDSTYTLTSNAYIPDSTNTIAQRQAVASSVAVTTGSGNLSLDATASASSSKGSNTPEQANDDGAGTYWQANTQGDGEWLAMDYSSATTVDQIVVKENDKIAGVNIQWSTDGSSWTTVSGLSVTESPAKTWTCTFTAASKRYFRGVFTASGSQQRVSVEEFESYDTSSSGLTLTDEGTFTTAW